jgi:phospholipid/cholesterol/gamma-HCH transport system substrate-binding protein
MRRNKSTFALLPVLLLAGCGYQGASSLPLPGAKGNGGYTVTMVFDDVANLVPKETCRAGDVVVGSVESIELRDDLKATVVCRIEKDIQLAGNAVATVRETSLLGERFVALDPPAGAEPVGTLEPGASIDQSKSHVVPNVEVVFGALSQVLNGGGLANIETISRELNIALGDSDLGGTTDELSKFVSTLNGSRHDIVDALEAVDRLAKELNGQRNVIEEALDSVPQGLAVLERQRPRIVRTLRELGKLSDVAIPLIRDTKEATVADLENLGPILHDLARAKDRLSRALEAIITFPFPSYTKYVTKGDYAGMFATVTLDLNSLNHLLGLQQVTAGSETDGSTSTAGDPDAQTPGLQLPDLQLPDLQLPGLQLPDPLSQLLQQLPGLENGLPLLNRPTEQIEGRLSDNRPRSLSDLLTGGGS